MPYLLPPSTIQTLPQDAAFAKCLLLIPPLMLFLDITSLPLHIVSGKRMEIRYTSHTENEQHIVLNSVKKLELEPKFEA